MNYLSVAGDTIARNCAVLSGALAEHGHRLFLMAKSNLYGFGYPLLDRLRPYLAGIAGPGAELDSGAAGFSGKRITRFDPAIPPADFCYVFREEDIPLCHPEKTYLRVDPFLGLHGLSPEALDRIPEPERFHGLFVYINEYLTPEEEGAVKALSDFSQAHGLVLNIGGSAILDHLRLLPPGSEIRLLRRVLFSSREQAPMYPVCRVLAKGPGQTVGFKSDRVRLDGGICYLLSMGYYECKWLPVMYRLGLPLILDGREYRIPCYPCMNTMWLWSPEDTLPLGEVALLSQAGQVEALCASLDLDSDEYYASFPGELPRIYEQR